MTSDAQKAERLFRAAVSAFCSLPRPSRREISQLEDLALPLFDLVSVEAKRYVAAALSECDHPPLGLVRRLCDETVDIAAPLLVRSSALGDVDLIALIARHGYGHARAIGRRQGLNPAIARLVAALEKKIVPLRPGREPVPSDEAVASTEHLDAGSAAEDARHRLRAMMVPATTPTSTSKLQGRSAYDRLREGALSGHPAFFQTALADALGHEFSVVRATFGEGSYAWLLDALRALEVSDEKAFLITAALYPSLFGDLHAIRLFLWRYAALSRDEAVARIGLWHAEVVSRELAAAAEVRVAG